MKALENKLKLNTEGSTDSMFQRSTSAKAGTIGQGGFNGKKIKRMLGLDDEGHKNVGDLYPSDFMDIVLQMWDGDAVANAKHTHGMKVDDDLPSYTDEENED